MKVVKKPTRTLDYTDVNKVAMLEKEYTGLLSMIQDRTSSENRTKYLKPGSQHYGDTPAVNKWYKGYRRLVRGCFYNVGIV